MMFRVFGGVLFGFGLFAWFLVGVLKNLESCHEDVIEFSEPWVPRFVDQFHQTKRQGGSSPVVLWCLQ